MTRLFLLAAATLAFITSDALVVCASRRWCLCSTRRRHVSETITALGRFPDSVSPRLNWFRRNRFRLSKTVGLGRSFL
jgi:hypothetical protein